MAPLATLHGELSRSSPLDLATRTTSHLASAITRVLPRQATVTVIPANNNVNGSDLSGGAIAGIVIGSIIGFLLLCWIFRCALGAQTSQGYVEDDRPHSSHYYHQDIRASSRSPHRHHHHHHHRSHSRGRHSRSRSGVRVVSSTTQAVPIVEPDRVYYGEKRHHSRRRSGSRYD